MLGTSRGPELRTAALTLRPPLPEDEAFYAMSEPGTRREVRRRAFADVLAAWETHGVDHWVVTDAASGGRLAWCGLRVEADALHLFVWVAPDLRERGIASEAARAVVAWAVEHRPGERVVAVVRADNTASARTAERAGLLAVAAPSGSAYGRWELARMERSVDGGGREQVLDLWHATVRAGGAVGLRADATREDVARVLDEQLARERDGRSVGGRLRGPDGALVGLAWWQLTDDPLFAHRADLARLMVDPELRGRHLGRLLLAGMHTLARTLPGVDVLTLDYRAGTGLGDFYAAAGYVEVGRWPGLIEVTPGEYRDSVAMMRRLGPSASPSTGGRRASGSDVPTP